MPATTKYFTVTVPQGLSNIRLDSKGYGTCQVTVKNASRAAMDGRAILVSLPVTRPPAGVVEKNWVQIQGSAERHFAIDQEEVFSIKIAVPQKKSQAAPAGNYSFRLDVVNVARPDESSDQSQALGFTVAPAPPPKPLQWPLIALVAALALLVGGVTVWLLLRPKSGSTTDAAPNPTPGPISTPVTTPRPVSVSTPIPTPLQGTWINDKETKELESQDVSQLDIAQVCKQDGSCRVQAQGKCESGDCFAGIAADHSPTNDTVYLEWKDGKTLQWGVSLKLTSPGHLECMVKSLSPNSPTRGQSFTNHLHRKE